MSKVLIGGTKSRELYWVIGSWEKRNLRVTTNRPRGKIVREPFDSRISAEKWIAYQYLINA